MVRVRWFTMVAGLAVASVLAPYLLLSAKTWQTGHANHDVAASRLAVIAGPPPTHQVSVSSGSWQPKPAVAPTKDGGGRLLQVCLYSGGDVARATAQQNSFVRVAHQAQSSDEQPDIYYITNAKLIARNSNAVHAGHDHPMIKTITVPPDIEAAGYKALPRKTLALFAHLSTPANLAKYKFAMKVLEAAKQLATSIMALQCTD